MVKKQGKDEKILGDSEELTIQCYKLKHTNESKWLNSTKKTNNEKLQEDFFFFFKLNKVRYTSHSKTKKKHMETNASFNGKSKSNREIAEMLLKR